MSVAQFPDLAEELERAVQNLQIVMAENADEIMASLAPNTTQNAANELAGDREPWQELVKIRNNDSDDNIDENDVSDNDHQWKILSQIQSQSSVFVCDRTWGNRKILLNFCHK